MTKDVKIQVILEQLIDDATLDYILDALEQVCYLKAEHIIESWQDEILADTWQKIGEAIADVSQLANEAGL